MSGQMSGRLANPVSHGRILDSLAVAAKLVAALCRFCRVHDSRKTLPCSHTHFQVRHAEALYKRVSEHCCAQQGKAASGLAAATRL